MFGKKAKKELDRKNLEIMILKNRLNKIQKKYKKQFGIQMSLYKDLEKKYNEICENLQSN
jgi:protoheme ferro-lyase